MAILAWTFEIRRYTGNSQNRLSKQSPGSLREMGLIMVDDLALSGGVFPEATHQRRALKLCPSIDIACSNPAPLLTKREIGTGWSIQVGLPACRATCRRPPRGESAMTSECGC
jgi:hypothetical protein